MSEDKIKEVNDDQLEKVNGGVGANGEQEKVILANTSEEPTSDIKHIVFGK